MDGDARLVPVGHDLGAFHDGSGGQCQQVRVGAELVELDDSRYAAWVAAHGDEVVDELPSKQLVAAVDPAVEFASTHRLVPLVLGLGNSAEGQVAFAEAHRLEPLLVGLGNSAEYPDTYAVGLPGNPPVAMLDSGSYELWQWAAVAPSLWQACEVRAKVGAGLGDPTSAADLLDDVLGDLRPLLANSCAYLDVIRRR
jgi:hypothetical protein